jgi:hypothetical protein
MESVTRNLKPRAAELRYSAKFARRGLIGVTNLITAVILY